MIDIPDSIFPKDDAGQSLCPKCKKLIVLCDCPLLASRPVKAVKIIPKIGLDRSGRKGKVVTTIKNLPVQITYLKDLAKMLKSKTGSGGTFYVDDGFGSIEIQGDHQAIVRSFFNNSNP